MSTLSTVATKYQAQIKAANRRGVLAGSLGMGYALALIIISYVFSAGGINWGVPLYILLGLPVTLLIWFAGEIFERCYWAAQLVMLGLIASGTYYLWTYQI